MTRLAFGAVGASDFTVDGLGVTATPPTIVASPFTGGGPNAIRTVASATVQVYAFYALTLTSGRGYYLRVRTRISGAPSVDTLLLSFGNPNPATVSNVGLALQAGSRDIRLWGGAAVRGVAGPTLAVDTDYLLEVFVNLNTAADDTVTGRVDGTQFATFTGALTTSLSTAVAMGLHIGAGITAHFTDWALNDDQGSNNNSWPGDGRVKLLVPVSDDTGNSTISADAWRAGNTGTTNLFAAVDNTPPVGVASAGSTTSQIVCDTPSTARNYVAVTAAYDTAMAAGDTIQAVQGVIAHGESVTTGTKTGTCDLFANPAGSVSASFNYGNDAGGAGTYPTLWTVTRAPLVEAPTPTRSSGASIRVTANTNTRNVDVCFMGVYVDYLVAAAAAKAPPPTFRPLRIWNRRR